MISFRRSAKNIFREICEKRHDEDFVPSKQPEPTEARPGSIEKMQVLSARLMAGEELHHPSDVTIAATIEEQSEMAKLARARYAGRLWQNGKLVG